MKKSILEIYALLVCFVAVITLFVNIGITIYSVIGVNAPDITMSAYDYERYQSNDVYWHRKNIRLEDNQKPKRPAEPVLTQKRLKSYAVSLRIEVRNNWQSILQSSIVFLLSALLFFLHWRFILNKKHD